MSGSLGEFGEGDELHIQVLEHRSGVCGSWSLREEEIVRIKTFLKLTKIPRGFELPLAMERDLKPISFRSQGGREILWLQYGDLVGKDRQKYV